MKDDVFLIDVLPLVDSIKCGPFLAKQSKIKGLKKNVKITNSFQVSLT